MSARLRNTKENKELCLIWKKNVLSIMSTHSRKKNSCSMKPGAIDERIDSEYELRMQIINYLNGPNSTYAKKHPRQYPQLPSCEIWSFHFAYNFNRGGSEKLYFKIILNKATKTLKILSAHKDT